MTVGALIPVPASILPKSGNFSGHETFTFRYAWPKKGLDALENRSDIFSADEAMVQLGVGKNMVRSIRHWCLATALAVEAPSGKGLVPSTLGRSIFLESAWDPFLEDDGTLWLLHWHLATNMTRATTWYWAFNILKEQEFTHDTLRAGLERLSAERNWTRASASTLRSDVSCFVRTYAAGKRGVTSTFEDTLDCPLVNLGLLIEVSGSDRYRFNNGPKPGLPAAIFAYALLDCWAVRHAEQETLSFRELMYGEGSPGRVFRLDDTSALTYLDALKSLTNGRLEYDDTSLAARVRRIGDVSGGEILRAYYAH